MWVEYSLASLRFASSGHRFIEKIVQLPFRVPPLALEQATFLDELIPNWLTWESDLPADFPNHIRDISDFGLGANPRQIKRLINSFLLLKQVMYARDVDIDLKLAAALIGVQLRWPAHFRDFHATVLLGELPDSSDPLPNLIVVIPSQYSGIKQVTQTYAAMRTVC